MLHPDILLLHSYKYNHREVAQYISLCSFRSPVDYLVSRELALDLVLVPGLNPEETINKNRLLHLEEDKVHFLYEEVPESEIH